MKRNQSYLHSIPFSFLGYFVLILHYNYVAGFPVDTNTGTSSRGYLTVHNNKRTPPFFATLGQPPLLDIPTQTTVTADCYNNNNNNHNNNSITSIKMLRDTTKTVFRGKNVLLTGASGGLGRSLAMCMAECNVAHLIISARQQSALEVVQKEIQHATTTTTTMIHIITADLSNPTSVQQLAKQTLLVCPTIDILINCGGVSSRSRFVDTTLDVDQRVMQINFLAGAALAKALVPGMISTKEDDGSSGGGGRIIWISSVQGLLGIPNRTSYAASKFAVQGYCEALRAELFSSNVYVHVVSPGYIRTNLSRSALRGDGTTHNILDPTTAQGADPDEVAKDILDQVAAGRMDFTIATDYKTSIAIWMRLLCPKLLQKMLVKRYEKSIKEKKE